MAEVAQDRRMTDTGTTETKSTAEATASGFEFNNNTITPPPVEQLALH